MKGTNTCTCVLRNPPNISSKHADLLVHYAVQLSHLDNYNIICLDYLIEADSKRFSEK